MMAQEAERITNVSQIKPNTIVQYEGGGYDGCFYELNYAYFDAEGKFHNLHSSGYKGCDTVEKLQTAIEQANRQEQHGRPSRLDFYQLDNAEEIARFGRETPISHLLSIGKWFQQIEVTLTVVCDVCGNTVPVIDATGEGQHGIGGIMSEHNQIICSVCEDAGTCRYCGSYVGEKCIEPETGYCTGKKDGGWTGCHEKHGNE